MRLLSFILLAACGSFALGAEETVETKPIRVLLLSGQNNHQWERTTPKLESILESTGRFKVDVTNRPDQITAELLKCYDVVLSNWNTWGKGENVIKEWPESTKTAYLDSVRNGGGHVVVHAGSSSFFDWDEYMKLTLATWKLGETSHGPQHDFTVRIKDPKHPITQGIADFKIHGELWNRPGMQKGVTVLATAFSEKEHRGTGQEEPTAMIAQYGKGRSFTLLLGHGVEEMEHQAFATLLTRGTEWAATGVVSIGD